MDQADSPARARDPDPAALAWVDADCVRDRGVASRETDLFTREVVLDAFVAGRDAALQVLIDAGRSQLALTLDVLDRFRDGKGPFTPADAGRAGAMIRLATAKGEEVVDVPTAGVDLLREAAALFREYEGHHLAKVEATKELCEPTSARAKAERNAAIATRIEEWLAGSVGRGPVPNSVEASLVDPEAGGECRTCAAAIETRLLPCDECGRLDESNGDDGGYGERLQVGQVVKGRQTGQIGLVIAREGWHTAIVWTLWVKDDVLPEPVDVIGQLEVGL